MYMLKKRNNNDKEQGETAKEEFHYKDLQF